LFFIQVLHQVGTTILLTRSIITVIKKWILMICAILKTYILTFHQVQLPMSESVGPYAQFLANMPDWTDTDMSQDAFNKAFSALPLPFHHPAVQFMRPYRKAF